MIANTVVRARIDEKTKAEATAVLASIGLTLSDAVRLMLMRVAAEKALPFEPLIPNAETIEAIMESQRGELITVGSVEETRFKRVCVQEPEHNENEPETRLAKHQIGRA